MEGNLINHGIRPRSNAGEPPTLGWSVRGDVAPTKLNALLLRNLGEWLLSQWVDYMLIRSQPVFNPKFAGRVSDIESPPRHGRS